MDMTLNVNGFMNTNVDNTTCFFRFIVQEVLLDTMKFGGLETLIQFHQDQMRHQFKL